MDIALLCGGSGEFISAVGGLSEKEAKGRQPLLAIDDLVLGTGGFSGIIDPDRDHSAVKVATCPGWSGKQELDVFDQVCDLVVPPGVAALIPGHDSRRPRG